MSSPYEFMITALGGKDRVTQRFLHEKLSGFDRKNTTVEELIRCAKDDGWIVFLGELPCITLRRLLTQNDEKSSANSVSGLNSGISQTRRTILNFVFDHPWHPLEEIASQLELPEETVAQELEAFRSKQLLLTKDEGGTTLYAPVA